VNESIRVREVRVIGADSEQLGVMAPEEALEKAQEAGLDLVEVAANSRPPVCRIMDYGRYKYEQKKKRAKGRQSHTATLKEVKLRPGTDMHDLEFKLNNVRRFLIEGDKVKVTVMFRGREMVHTYRGRERLRQALEHLGPIAKLENPPRMEGRFLSMILVGDREVVAEAKRQEAVEKAAAAAEAEATEKKTKKEDDKSRFEEAKEESPEASSDESPETQPG
jgi:translation initiation factor IF-3